MKPLRDQSFNTLACSYMTLALKAYSDLARSTGVEVSILGIANGNSTPQLLAGPSQGIIRADFEPTTNALRFERKQKGDGDIGAFYQVVEQGYDSGKPDRPGTQRTGSRPRDHARCTRISRCVPAIRWTWCCGCAMCPGKI